MDHGTSIMELKGVGEKSYQALQKLDIKLIGDLISHFPLDYETFQKPVLIAETKSGDLCAIKAEVCGIPNVKKVRNLTIINVLVRDHSGAMQLTFFNMPYLKNVLKNHGVFIFRGRVQAKGMSIIMEQPKILSLNDYDRLTKCIQPRYGLTKGITNAFLQKCMKQALTYYHFEKEPYPKKFLDKYSLCTYKEAITDIHFPITFEDMLRARRRLVFDEFFAFLWQLRANKEYTDKIKNRYQMIETADTVRFLERLPFSLTNAQKKVWAEIRNDLSSDICMNRLIQGDVGSGKTIIAILGLLMCVSNGYQGAMMAPTEVLATQHYEEILSLTKAYNLPFVPVLLVGSMTAKEKKEAYAKIASGEANIVIGTHAVIQEKVEFQKLALVITDEQHRFGVRQREVLANKGVEPHVLVMSATPIPRTLAIIMYGDLQVSIIDELPSNRLPIKNCVVNTSYRQKAYEFITKEVRSGRQCYVVCPMVEEGIMDELENVVDYAEKLKIQLPQDIIVGILHGKMKPADKNRIMEAFARNDIHVLVSTTVIEVGINVPNATVMMVENAERFGLAQLHQLRGRVGRGEYQSYCIFVSGAEQKETMERLNILNQSNDGFYIASEDLKLRGPGDLFGIRQSGEFAFQMGDVFTDANLLKQASEAVDSLFNGELSEDDSDKVINALTCSNHYRVDFRTI